MDPKELRQQAEHLHAYADRLQEWADELQQEYHDEDSDVFAALPVELREQLLLRGWDPTYFVLPETLIAEGETKTITLTPPRAFVLERLILDSAECGSYVVEQLRVGSQELVSSPTSADVFSGVGAFALSVGGNAGMEIVLTVTRKPSAALRGVFRGKIESQKTSIDQRSLREGST
jgi:hypothetical protein